MAEQEPLEITFERCQELIAHLDGNALDCNDRYLIKRIISSHLELLKILQEKDIKLGKYKGMIFGEAKSGKAQDADAKNAAAQKKKRKRNKPINENDNAANDNGKKKNKGRMGVSDYPGAKDAEIPLEGLSKGEPCPYACGGRLYPYASQEKIRISGGEIATAIRYQLKRLRCNLCNEIFAAKLPDGVSEEKYDARFKACLCVHKYFLGTPWYRIEALQRFLGVPLPDSTQWQLTDSVGDCVYVVYYRMLYYAAQASLFFHDDTRTKILSVALENLEKLKKDKKGTHTTGVIAKVGEHVIYLFISGVKHGGRNMSDILKKRLKKLPPPIIMSDALAANNIDKEKDINRANCLYHGRRKFDEIDDFYPDECQIVIDTINKVFEHEAVTKAEQMDNQKRLEHHKTHSAPLLEVLHKWMEKLHTGNAVESNCSLGKAIKYMLKHWEKLTRFLSVPGCPIDNNLMEATLKICIRVRKNSMFFKTEHGAFVGGMLTSLIVTAMQNDVNPIDYLTALQENKSAVFKNPDAWLPWNYRENLKPSVPEVA